MLEHLAPQIFNGLVLGAFYAIVGIGLSLIMNLTGTINMAHGSFMTLAGYLAFTMVSRGTSFGFALIAAPLIAVDRRDRRRADARASALQARAVLQPAHDVRALADGGRDLPPDLGRERRAVLAAARARRRGGVWDS